MTVQPPMSSLLTRKMTIWAIYITLLVFEAAFSQHMNNPFADDLIENQDGDNSSYADANTVLMTTTISSFIAETSLGTPVTTNSIESSKSVPKLVIEENQTIAPKEAKSGSVPRKGVPDPPDDDPDLTISEKIKKGDSVTSTTSVDHDWSKPVPVLTVNSLMSVHSETSENNDTNLSTEQTDAKYTLILDPLNNGGNFHTEVSMTHSANIKDSESKSKEDQHETDQDDTNSENINNKEKSTTVVESTTKPNTDQEVNKLNPLKVENETVSPPGENGMSPVTVETRTFSIVLSTTPESMNKPATAFANTGSVSTGSTIIITILLVIVVCSMVGIIYWKVIKRGMQRRHYERVDFLIDGMYDGDL